MPGFWKNNSVARPSIHDKKGCPMLSRTADHLFWMARHTERAENTARMLDVNVQTALLPQSAHAAEQGWRAMLGISELLPAFDDKYGLLNASEVLDFMVRDPDNPSS